MIPNSRISIVVPCYNQAQYLDECLQSVLDQSYGDWECIIVNDGSPDDTESVANHWLEKDARFRYLKKENGGLSSARNAGIQSAKGIWILPLDADDKISDDYLTLAASHLGDNVAIIYAEANFFGIRQGKWQLPDFSMFEIAVQNVIFCAAFFRKQDWQRVGGYDEQLRHGWEDWEFWISLLQINPNVYKIPQVCFYYRIKEQSMMTDFSAQRQKRDDALRHIYLKHAAFFMENLGFYLDIITDRIELRRIQVSVRYRIGDFVVNSWLRIRNIFINHKKK